MEPRRLLHGAGFTLPELLVALAVLAVLATQAVPTLGTLLARHRLALAAEDVRRHLEEARREARLRGAALLVRVRPGRDWRLGCPCPPRDSCPPCLDARRHPGVRLASVRPATGSLRFDGVRGLASPATLVLAAGETHCILRLALSGRVRRCGGGAHPC